MPDPDPAVIDGVLYHLLFADDDDDLMPERDYVGRRRESGRWTVESAEGVIEWTYLDVELLVGRPVDPRASPDAATTPGSACRHRMTPPTNDRRLA